MTHPYYIICLFDSVKKTNNDDHSYYHLSYDIHTFDKNHDFKNLVSYFSSYYDVSIIEQSRGEYFIFSLKDSFIGININECDRYGVIFNIYRYNNLELLKSKMESFYFDYYYIGGNYIKYTRL